MKKVISLVLIVALMSVFSGCAYRKTITTKVDNSVTTRTYEPYGLFDMNKKNPNIQYEVSIGNIVWSAVLFETVIAPIILIGWYAYEPVGPIITNPNMRGVVK